MARRLSLRDTDCDCPQTLYYPSIAVRKRDPPDSLAAGKEMHRLGVAMQRIGGKDQRPDEFLRGKRVERLQFAPTHWRIAACAARRADADHRATPEQNAVGGVGGYGAAGKTGNEQFASVVDTSERYILCDSHRIQHDVGAGVRGKPVHRFVNARFGVVDKVIGAELSGILELLGSGRGQRRPWRLAPFRFALLRRQRLRRRQGPQDFGPPQERSVSRAHGKP